MLLYVLGFGNQTPIGSIISLTISKFITPPFLTFQNQYFFSSSVPNLSATKLKQPYTTEIYHTYRSLKVQGLEQPAASKRVSKVEGLRRGVPALVSATEDTDQGFYASEESGFAVLAAEVRRRGIELG